MKTQINIKLSEDILEKLDEKAKKEHRTRTNLIEKILIDKLGIKQYWLWVNSANMDIGDDLKEGEEIEWRGCDPRSYEGDLVLIYRVSPYSHIKYIAQITDEAKPGKIETDREPEDGFYCNIKILSNFEHPFKIHDMRDYPSLKDWFPLKLNFHRMFFKIEEKDWNILRDIIITNNRNSKDYF